MIEREYGTICLNLGFMSGMFFAASGDMPAEFSTATNVIRAICEGETIAQALRIREKETIAEALRECQSHDETAEGATATPAAPVPETQIETQEDTKRREEAEFKRSVCERLDAFRQENKLGSFKELSKIVNYRISQDNIVRIFNREPVDISKYRILNTALNK